MIFFFFLEVTLKSILCQSQTPVVKKLLLIALTVRLFVGKLDERPAPSARIYEGFCSLGHTEGLKAYSSNQRGFSSRHD